MRSGGGLAKRYSAPRPAQTQQWLKALPAKIAGAATPGDRCSLLRTTVESRCRRTCLLQHITKTQATHSGMDLAGRPVSSLLVDHAGVGRRTRR